MGSYEYAFTVTLKPKLYDHDATEQYDNTYHILFETLLRISFKNQFTLVAEQTKAYNIHYHGIIILPLKVNCMKYFHDSFRKSKIFGFVNIKQITEQQIWIDYISKSIKETRDCINRPPIIYDWKDYIKTEELTNCISHISELYD